MNSPETPLLTQIPDLDATPRHARPSEGAEPEPPSDGRVISQRVSNWLVIGGGIVLVIAAIVPLALRKAVPAPAAPPATAPAADIAKKPAGAPAAPERLVAKNAAIVQAQPPAPPPRGPETPRSPVLQADQRASGGQESRDYRNHYPGVGVADGSPLMPAPSAMTAETSQPGVARLEGTIGKPPQRTEHERAGSGLY